MFGFEDIVLIAMFIQATVQAFKPLWDKSAQWLTAPEFISIGIGIVIALVAKINMLDGLIADLPVAVEYIFCGLTGVGIGRGPSFIHDLWSKMRGGTASE